MPSGRKGTKSTVRTNISVETGLKSRMEQMPGVNWSQVASRAFEARIRSTEPEETVDRSTEIGKIQRIRNAVAEIDRFLIKLQETIDA